MGKVFEEFWLTYPFEDFATMQPLLRRAFDEWAAMGMVTLIQRKH